MEGSIGHDPGRQPGHHAAYTNTLAKGGPVLRDGVLVRVPPAFVVVPNRTTHFWFNDVRLRPGKHHTTFAKSRGIAALRPLIRAPLRTSARTWPGSTDALGGHHLAIGDGAGNC
jgi:hypothetical protein